MNHQDIDIHAARLVDLPMIARLVERSAILDTELACTRDASISQNLLLERIPLSQRELYTFVGRAGRLPIAGQFRLKPDNPVARVVYIAPALDENQGDSAYLHLLDAMIAEAGRRGAHALTAEVDEFAPLFVTMRTAGFAVYARQQLWGRAPSRDLPAHITPAQLDIARDEDAGDIQALYCNIVPKLVQPVGVTHSDTGFVYRKSGKRGIQGYIAASEGKNGIFLLPLLDPDILFEEAAAIIAGAMVRFKSLDRLPVYICVRRYQDWLEETLIDLAFEPGRQQAVMVRHIAVGVRHATFAPVRHALEAVPAVPPTSRVHKAECSPDF
jgi:hypothetical protein